MMTPETEQTIVKGYEEEKLEPQSYETSNPTVNAVNNMNVNTVIPIKHNVSDMINYLNSELKRFKEQKEQNIKQTHQLKDNLLILSGAIQIIEHLLIKFE